MTVTQTRSALVSDINPAVLDAQRQLNEMLAGLPANPDPRTSDGLIALRRNTSPPQADITSDREDIVIDGPDATDLRLHVVTPAGPVRAVMLRIHGGGYVAGAPEDDDTFNDQLARSTGIAIVSPNYRLAPEASVADGTQDCLTAMRWLGNHAQQRFGTTRLVVGGNSAGASHAVQTLIALRDAGDPEFSMIEAVLLDCGAYDLSGTPSARAADEKTLILPHDFLFSLFDLGSESLDLESRRTAITSPLYADLAGLPPALIFVGAQDPLSDDSRFLAARWQAAGNFADLDVWPEGVHAFANMNTPLGAVALRRVAEWLETILFA